MQAIRELKKERKCPQDVKHRQIKSLNNMVEADRDKLKQLVKPVPGFKTIRTAYATIEGFEVMRAFGAGPCVMTEAVTLIEEHFKAGSPWANFFSKLKKHRAIAKRYEKTTPASPCLSNWQPRASGYELMRRWPSFPLAIHSP